MTKKETIWRHILHQALTKQSTVFTQKELASHLGISTSTVFNALKAPRKLGAIEVTGRFFRLCDGEKLALLWATQRNLKKDIIYSTHVEESVQKIEGSMPPDIIFGLFSAYRLKFNDAPADYSRLYIYANNLSEIKKRFPPQKGPENLFILQPDPYLSSFGQITPDIQTFVDLWNTTEWYAKDFLEALKRKIKFFN